MNKLNIYDTISTIIVLLITFLVIKSSSSRVFNKRDSHTNLCLFIYCQNGGTCFYSNNLAHCKCAQGFSGMWCQFVSNKKPFTQRQIQNYIMTPMIPEVVVVTPATSLLSDGESILNEYKFSICSVVKCQNGYFSFFVIFNMNTINIFKFKGGKCVEVDENSLECICQVGFTGRLCEKQSDEILILTTKATTTVTTTTKISSSTKFSICLFIFCKNGKITK
jgi:hypothetical protein